MRILRSEEALGRVQTCIALGTFDGVHLGHQKLIIRMVETAKQLGAQSLVYTFDRHPISLLCPQRAPEMLLSREEMIARMEKLGVENLIIRPFDAEFAALSPMEFLLLLKEKLNCRSITVGENYTFGRGGAGNVDFLRENGKKLGIDVDVVPPETDNGEIVSSTLIRNLKKAGDFERARRLMAMKMR